MEAKLIFALDEIECAINSNRGKLELTRATPSLFFSVCAVLNARSSDDNDDCQFPFDHQQQDYADIAEADLSYYAQLNPFYFSIFNSEDHTAAFVEP